MIFSYGWRLFCLCLAAFALLHAALALVLAAVGARLTGWAGRLAPAAAARCLLCLRLFPAALALTLVLGLCLPSYLLFEPAVNQEATGAFCLGAACLGAVAFLLAWIRAGRALARTLRLDRQYRQLGQMAHLEGAGVPACLLRGSAPYVLLTGILRARVVISQRVVEALTAEELAVVMRHEGAHGRSRDNLKKLLLLLTPDVLPGVRAFHRLELAWARLAEWAADDQAAGDPRSALCLASALVRVARLGSTPAAPALSTSLLSGGSELEQRVDRLLRPAGAPTVAGRGALWSGAAILLAVALAIAVALPASLRAAHECLEFLIQ